jgi:peptidoglycan/xylan/chitin deacetylase (PgdA/CDA1 family)
VTLLYDRVAQALHPLQHRWGTADGVVALTFDDGPSEWTGAVLELLAGHDSRGTFFLIGEEICTRERERTLSRIIAAGGEVGNHTYTHPSDVADMSPHQLRDELRATTARIESVIQVTPRFWRAPHFSSNLTARIVAAGLGLREAGASLIPADYRWPAEQTAEFVLRSLRPGDIVDLHDGRPRNEPVKSSPDREATVRALSMILDGMQRRGLRSVPLSELDAYPQLDS